MCSIIRRTGGLTFRIECSVYYWHNFRFFSLGVFIVLSFSIFILFFGLFPCLGHSPLNFFFVLLQFICFSHLTHNWVEYTFPHPFPWPNLFLLFENLIDVFNLKNFLLLPLSCLICKTVSARYCPATYLFDKRSKDTLSDLKWAF